MAFARGVLGTKKKEFGQGARRREKNIAHHKGREPISERRTGRVSHWFGDAGCLFLAMQGFLKIF